MSEEQLSALLAKLKEDVGLQEKLKGAPDLDAVVAMAQEAGFDVSKEEFLVGATLTTPTLELSDEELENVSGAGDTDNPYMAWNCTDRGCTGGDGTSGGC